MLKPKKRKKKPVKLTKDDEKVEDFFIQENIDEIQNNVENAEVIQENSNEMNIDEIQNDLEENFENTFEEDDGEEDNVENVVDMAERRVEE